MDGFSQTNWYVLVDGQAYGPYAHNVMSEFVREGRIIPSSLVSMDAQQGYVAAGSLPVYHSWYNGASQMRPAAPQAPMSARASAPVSRPQAYSAPVQPQAAIAQPQASTAQTLYIIMAEIDPQHAMNFLRTLQGFGPVQRVGETVWLLKAQHELSQVKAALSACLSKQDRLFIHDCFANQQAWENISGDLDQRIRQIWQSVER